MGLKNLKLIFDHPQRIYFVGQTVSGRLVVEIDEPKKLRSIIVKFKGEAECKWTERRTVARNGKSETVTTHYRGYEKYFENSEKVFGGSGITEVLPAGEHSFLFSMMLFNHLPSSFEGQYGYVRYTVKATLDRPWKFDHEVKAAFTVLSHLDLNLDPLNREPVKIENNKYFCCCCCKSGPLTLVTHLPARGYVSGQIIPMTIEVDNASKVPVSNVVCELLQTVTYHARGATKQISVVVAKIELDGSVEENNSKTWASRITVPPLPSSALPQCSIIDVDYKLEVKAEPLGWHISLKNSLPITIGTIPLWQSTVLQQPLPFDAPQQFASAPSAPPFDNGTRFVPSFPYPDMPPPSYEECMFGTTSIRDADDSEHVLGTTGYNPRYATYTLLTTVPDTPAVGWVAPKA